MYRNPLDALREYVQNAHDSIQGAMRERTLRQNGGRIEIVVAEGKREIRIRDNGAGIAAADAASRLVNIGMSAKRLSQDAGFRGIGRLAGIAYCQKLRFSTQARDEAQGTEVVFDCDELRKCMAPGMQHPDDLVDVVQRYTTVSKFRTSSTASHFEVVMEGVRPEGDAFLDWDRIQRYLSQVAPVPFDTARFGFAGEIYDWAKKRNLIIPEVSILIKSEKVNLEVFKPYNKITYKTTRDLDIKVRGVRFFPEDASCNSAYWGWYGESNLPGMYAEAQVAGLRIRKNNIGIGLSEQMTDIFAEVSDSNSRFNSYLMGECHVLNPQVVPNAHRDDFEDSATWQSIRKDLIIFAKERSREIRDASSARNIDTEKLLQPIKKQVAAAEQKVTTGLASETDRKNLITSLERAIEKLSVVSSDGRSADDLQRIKEAKENAEMVKTAIATAPYVTQNLRTSLDKKQRKVIAEIVEILHNVLNPEDFERAREAIMTRFGSSPGEEA